MSAAAEGAGRLRQVIEAAAGPALQTMTVLSAKFDPYRFDRPSCHALGRWFADQVERFVPTGATIHLRGLHYAIVSADPKVRKPGDGLPYLNTAADWTWLQEHAANAARWLRYVDFDRIRDERNAAAEVYVPDAQDAEADLVGGLSADLPSLPHAMPTFECEGFVARQPYRIVFIGEKSSLGQVLRSIAEDIGAEMLLPTGEISATMLAEMAARAADDSRPCVVLYFSDFDPAGWQMPISVARKLQGLRDLLYPDLEVAVHAVALTRDQVREFGLPSTPLKDTEKRADRWREVWGVEQTEIDALAALRPGVLRQIALDAIKPFYDSTLNDRTAAARRDWIDAADASLRAHPRYEAIHDDIEAALYEVDTANARLRDTQRNALEILSEMEPPPIELPDASIRHAPPEPLFTTDDDFPTATLKLIARKALEGEGAS